MPDAAKPLEGQVAVVTGASRGIGRALAVGFARGPGPIINISSYLAEVMMPGMMSYSVSKIALEKLTQYLAEELQPKGIAANALRIELMIATEGWQYRNPDVDYSTWAKPDAASQAPLWLATRDPSHTGRVVTIAGGGQQMAAG